MGIAIYIIICLLVAPAGKGKRIGMFKTFLFSFLLTPIIGLYLALGSGRLNARGCNHCGNTENEAEFCGVCGKNEDGKSREELGIEL
ncbi:MAG: hypothetical protein NXI20_02050 [bacterium]|nr:hypothetical protein [bacterium]